MVASCLQTDLYKPKHARKAQRDSNISGIKTCSQFLSSFLNKEFRAGNSNAEDAEEALLDDEAGQVSGHPSDFRSFGDYELLFTAGNMP